jgi:hypothetical protein
MPDHKTAHPTPASTVEDAIDALIEQDLTLAPPTNEPAPVTPHLQTSSLETKESSAASSTSFASASPSLASLPATAFFSRTAAATSAAAAAASVNAPTEREDKKRAESLAQKIKLVNALKIQLSSFYNQFEVQDTDGSCDRRSDLYRERVQMNFSGIRDDLSVLKEGFIKNQLPTDLVDRALTLCGTAMLLIANYKQDARDLVWNIYEKAKTYLDQAIKLDKELMDRYKTARGFAQQNSTMITIDKQFYTQHLEFCQRILCAVGATEFYRLREILRDYREMFDMKRSGKVLQMTLTQLHTEFENTKGLIAICIEKSDLIDLGIDLFTKTATCINEIPPNWMELSRLVISIEDRFNEFYNSRKYEKPVEFKVEESSGKAEKSEIKDDNELDNFMLLQAMQTSMHPNEAYMRQFSRNVRRKTVQEQEEEDLKRALEESLRPQTQPANASSSSSSSSSSAFGFRKS